MNVTFNDKERKVGGTVLGALGLVMWGVFAIVLIGAMVGAFIHGGVVDTIVTWFSMFESH